MFKRLFQKRPTEPRKKWQVPKILEHSEVVFDDDGLRARICIGNRARICIGNTDHLIVTFPTYGESFDDVPYENDTAFQSSCAPQGERTMLHITDKTAHWLLGPGEFTRAVDVIKSQVEKIQPRQISLVGNSAGGTMALMVAPHLDVVNRVIAISPQTGLGIFHQFSDRRFRKWLSPILLQTVHPNWLFHALDKVERAYIFHGLASADGKHSTVVPNSEHVHHYIFPKFSHSLAQEIKEFVPLADLMNRCLSDDIPGLGQLCDSIGGARRGHAFSEDALHAHSNVQGYDRFVEWDKKMTSQRKRDGLQTIHQRIVSERKGLVTEPASTSDTERFLAGALL
ncbi:MAG: alpha/beta hydrolase [Pseudomonadota bacterium]